MNNWFRENLFLCLGIFITPFLVVIGLASAGGGHGTYVAARIVFPFACLSMGTYVGASVIVSLLAFLQWPVHGLLIDRASHKLRAVGSILGIHAAMCFWLFTKGSENFR